MNLEDDLLLLLGDANIGADYSSADFGQRLGLGVVVNETLGVDLSQAMHFLRVHAANKPDQEGGAFQVSQNGSNAPTWGFFHPFFPSGFGTDADDDLWIYEGDNLSGHVGWVSHSSSLTDRFPCHWNGSGDPSLLNANDLPGEATDIQGDVIVGFLRSNTVLPKYWTSFVGQPQTLNTSNSSSSSHYALAFGGQYVAGYADTGSQQVPEYWETLSSANTLLPSSVWPATWNGRFTDTFAASIGQLMVGYRDSSSGVSASAFLYKPASNQLWTVGEPVGPPSQMSESNGQIYFVGNTVGTDSAPYLWTGRIVSDALDGNALDYRAFAIPEGEAAPAQMTGINDKRQVGGVNAGSYKGWVAGKSNGVYTKCLLDTGAFVHEPAGGASTGTASDAQKPDGKEFIKSKQGIVSSQIVRITTESTVGTGFTVWFRSTSKVDAAGSFNLQTEFWNYTTSAWDIVASNGTLKTRYTTTDYPVGSDYVSSTGRTKARMTVLVGFTAVSNWNFYLEQATWIKR